MPTQIYDPGNVPIYVMVNQGNPCTILARIYDQNGNLCVQSSVSNVTVTVYDLDTNTESNRITASVEQSIFNSLQQDGRWTADNIGYNFAVTLGITAFNSGSDQFQVQAVITPTSGDPWTLLANVQARQNVS